ncbi:crinkler family protein [Gigaspora margarita]|uniref:Crinkler family protein n=1 Tax=Gigaspora margarita TaxID=4874 RepID=A0A8H3XGK9_GIGMA|nr:crinkler family protein [Gigaspora margarita]
MSIYQLPKAFQIKICRDTIVSQIRKLLINDKLRFTGIDEEEIILWHVDIPTKDVDLGTTIKVEDIKGEIEMSLFADVENYFCNSEHYDEQKPNRHINIIMQIITTEKILEFLQAKFKKLPGLPLITTYGCDFPFVGRMTTTRCLTESFISQFKAACKGSDRNERPIFISDKYYLAGAPGTGKTRNLIETILMIRSCFPDFATNETQKQSHLLDDPVQILMTYNNNFLPLKIEKTLGADSAIGLRILHNYFASKSYHYIFIDQMIDKFGVEPLKKLYVSMAIDIIAKSIRGDNVSCPLLIYIALDEFQKLVGAPFCNGDNEQERRQYLKEVTLALGYAMCHEFSINNIFIICHLAGTLLTPLSSVIASSSYQHIALPTPLLLPVDINFLFEQLQLTRSWWLNSLLL